MDYEERKALSQNLNFNKLESKLKEKAGIIFCRFFIDKI